MRFTMALIATAAAAGMAAAPAAVLAAHNDDSSSSSSSTDCDSDGTAATYSETVTDQSRVIGGSGCVNYEEVSHTPGETQAAVVSPGSTVPAYPMLSGSDTSLSAVVNGVGLLYSGLQVFSCYGGDPTSPCVDWSTSAVNTEGDTFNTCGGHSTKDGDYHYHVAPSCLSSQLGSHTDGSSKQVGWMYDGFPVYGNTHPNDGLWKECGSDGADSTYCTDSCGGYAGEYPHDSFMYRYFMMGVAYDQSDNNSIGSPVAEEGYFPHTPLCMKGCCPDGVSCDSTVPNCSGSATTGTVDGYTATETSPWDSETVPTYVIGSFEAWTSSASASDDDADATAADDSSGSDTSSSGSGDRSASGSGGGGGSRGGGGSSGGSRGGGGGSSFSARDGDDEDDHEDDEESMGMGTDEVSELSAGSFVSMSIGTTFALSLAALVVAF